jgi:phosphofurin acidic cluster sorting protein 2
MFLRPFFNSCNSNAKPPSTIKILLMGGDWLEGAVLRHYVELLGIRPPDWVNHLRFYIVPLGQCAISRYLGQLDAGYSALFANDHWLQLCERAASNILDNSQTKSEMNELTSRIHKYLQSGGPCTQIPIAEAMVNYKDEDSCQVFVPFISVSGG